MIRHYNTLRQKYIVDGFAEAFEFIETLETENLPEILLANFYCYITIQSEFKAAEALEILENCLKQQKCSHSLRALTLYHIASVHFKMENYNKCRALCQQNIQQFIGAYYSLQKRLERTELEDQICEQLQEILYYVFLMVAYISKAQSNLQECAAFLQAGKRIIKDRQNVMSLTAKSNKVQRMGTAPSEGQNMSSVCSPFTKEKGSLGKFSSLYSI